MVIRVMNTLYNAMTYMYAAIIFQVHCFIVAPDSETMDDMTFGLPLTKRMGNNVHIATKAIVRL